MNEGTGPLSCVAVTMQLTGWESLDLLLHGMGMGWLLSFACSATVPTPSTDPTVTTVPWTDWIGTRRTALTPRLWTT